MSKIEIMNEDLSNKIAAGEVVEKVMNVVKELVENSIDAEATFIKVELKESGISEITVTDDGIGMDKDDAVKCFSRHATSKLHTLNDLFNITSLGFRGEALPSIASVSNVVLKTSNGKTGTLVKINGGELESVSDTDLRRGTIITVKNLFYNTPVRLKYLKSLYAELANITSYINKMALAYPNIKFILINDGKELLNTDGSGNLLKVINAIYGLSVTKKMMEIDASNDDFHIIGYTTYPEVNRSNKNNITILVNNRVIKNYEIIKTIHECYHTFMAQDKYPITVLNIIADPYLIDVNVHPTKMDVKFSKIEDLKALITDTITKKLKKTLLIQDGFDNTDFVLEQIENTKVKEEYYKPQLEEVTLNFEVGEDNKTYLESGVKEENKVHFDEREELIPVHEVSVKPIKPIGACHGTYIIGENEDGIYIIDQHAAAERINYEKCYRAILNHSKNKIDLLVPITIELPNDEYIILKKHFDILDNLGFIYEEFGINTIVIRSHPTWLPEYALEEAIRKIIDIIITEEDFSELKFSDRISMTMACKMSIKGNDAITLQDMEYLLNKLIQTDNPYTCPHGRPTIIKYTKYDLEKMFKRALD